MSLEKRISLVETAIITMKDLLVSHNDRLDSYFSALREAREDFEFKMNAIVDAQIRNQAENADLKTSVIELRNASQLALA